jgi:hypothetical protein
MLKKQEISLNMAASGQRKSQRTPLKTTETTQDVPTDGRERFGNRRKRQPSAPVVREKRGVDWEKNDLQIYGAGRK